MNWFINPDLSENEGYPKIEGRPKEEGPVPVKQVNTPFYTQIYRP